jgi:hypothetical protein
MAVLGGTANFLNAGQRGDRFKQAWVLLTNELIRFRADETYTLNHLFLLMRKENL